MGGMDQTGSEVHGRRCFLATLLVTLLSVGVTGAAFAGDEDEELRFPGDPPDHKLVYQFNKADEAYQKAVLFSVGAMLRQ